MISFFYISMKLRFHVYFCGASRTSKSSENNVLQQFSALSFICAQVIYGSVEVKFTLSASWQTVSCLPQWDVFLFRFFLSRFWTLRLRTIHCSVLICVVEYCFEQYLKLRKNRVCSCGVSTLDLSIFKFSMKRDLLFSSNLATEYLYS